EIYDRKLSDIFAVQSDIAKTVADTLQAKLTGAEKQMMAAAATTDTTAYELYHKGRSLWEKRSGDNIPKAIAFFEQAIARDPNYALAYAGLAQAYILVPFYTGADRYDEAARQMRKALEIDPTSFYAHYNLGIVLQLTGDLPGAIAEYEKAKQLGDNPLVSALCASAKALAGDKNAALRMLSDFDELS